jgi:archaellum biogenesis ATPase FlaH
MLSKQGDSLQYLLDVRDGKIKQGLGLDCFLDEHLRFKPKQLNIILGHDNVGKTYWINWYFLTLALKHNLTFCIWSGENQKGQILRDMIQMYRGKHFSKLSHSQISGDLAFLEQSFVFIDNTKLYKPDEVLELFKQSGANVGLIDPFTGLDREMSFAGNYEFMNRARQFVNQTGMTIYINTHPNSESGRSANLYQDGEWKGHLKPPLKDHIEGGKAF